MVSTTLVEQKQKQLNKHVINYISHINYEFSDAEIAELENLAQECVLNGGYVMQARNTLHIIKKQLLQYDDECLEHETPQSRGLIEEQILESPQNTVILLYPNPNHGKA